jgi:Ni,Fe-hydrogenase maturation factor
MVPGHVTVETLQQLELEWADMANDYDLVLFIDCHVSEIEDWTKITVIESGYEVGAISHHVTPTTLLGICQILHKRSPEGILFSVKGTDFNFGTELSEKTKQAADEIVVDILSLVKTGEMPRKQGFPPTCYRRILQGVKG